MSVCRRVVGILYLASASISLAAAAQAPPETFESAPSSGGLAFLVVDGVEHALTTAPAVGSVSANPTAGQGNAPLFALETVAETLGVLDRGAVGTDGRSLRLPDGTLVTLQPGSPTVTVGAEILTLSEATRVQGPFLFVPLDFFVRVLGEVAGISVAWDAPTQRLTLARGGTAPREVRVEQLSLEGTTTVVLDCGEPLPYRIVRSTNAVDVVFPAQRIRFVRAPVLDDPRVVRVEALVDRLRLLLAPGVGAVDYTLADPFRIVLDVHAEAAVPDVPTAPATPTIRRPGVHTIVLDPGHGGTETGAVGSRGTLEKDLTLALAQLVESKLKERFAVRVVLTRGEDKTLAHSARSALANQYKADLFVSLHINSSRGSTARGVETYFLSVQASDDRAAAAAEIENRSPTPGSEVEEGAAELELLLWDLAQTRHLARSQRLAGLIQEEFNSSLGLRDRGVKQAPFRVLMGAAMPAVLVEFGFLSNPEEEGRLADPGYRSELADALVAAVGRFKAELEGAHAAPAPAVETPAASTPVAPPSLGNPT